MNHPAGLENADPAGGQRHDPFLPGSEAQTVVAPGRSGDAIGSPERVAGRQEPGTGEVLRGRARGEPAPGGFMAAAGPGLSVPTPRRPAGSLDAWCSGLARSAHRGATVQGAGPEGDNGAPSTGFGIPSSAAPVTPAATQIALFWRSVGGQQRADRRLYRTVRFPPVRAPITQREQENRVTEFPIANPCGWSS